MGNSNVFGFHHVGDLNLGLQSPLQLEARLGSRLKEAALKGEKTLLGGGRALFASTVREQQELVSSLFQTSIKDTSPVRVLLSFKEENRTHFDQPFELKLEICLYNSSKIDVAHIQFELLLSTEAHQTGEYKTDFTFSGKNCFSCTLSPETQKSLFTSALFTNPGVYNLNRLKMTVTLGQENDSRCFIQSPIHKRLVYLYSN